MKILIAADGSPFTKRMLAYVAAHDEWLGPQHQYTVLTAVPKLPPRAAAVIDRQVVAEYYESQAEAVFKPIRSFFKQRGLEANFVSKVGPAAEAIVKEAGARRGYDLVLMGSHGHGSVLNVVMGSVATKVLAGCKVPVLIVR